MSPIVMQVAPRRWWVSIEVDYDADCEHGRWVGGWRGGFEPLAFDPDSNPSEMWADFELSPAGIRCLGGRWRDKYDRTGTWHPAEALDDDDDLEAEAFELGQISAMLDMEPEEVRP